ncbi:hypothetical protein V2J09_015811 [Rumex salicifolius]
MFANLKSTDGYLSNISHCVKDNGKKISCMKSHDHHVFIEQLLPLVVRGFLPKHVYEPLVELSSYFKNLCSKSIIVEQLEDLEKKFLTHYATYIRNRAHLEGSIAEGYLADECLTISSRYMNDTDTKFNRKARNDDKEGEVEGSSKSNLKIFRPLGRSIGQDVPLHLSYEDCDQIHFYVLNNCDELVEFARVVRRYTGYIVNGFRFHTNDRSRSRKTQNCGIMVRGDDSFDKEYYSAYDTRAEGQPSKRKRTSKLAARVATILQVTKAADPKPREEILIQEEEKQGNRSSTQSYVIGHNPETQDLI